MWWQWPNMGTDWQCFNWQHVTHWASRVHFSPTSLPPMQCLIQLLEHTWDTSQQLYNWLVQCGFNINYSLHWQIFFVSSFLQRKAKYVLKESVCVCLWACTNYPLIGGSDVLLWRDWPISPPPVCFAFLVDDWSLKTLQYPYSQTSIIKLWFNHQRSFCR